MFFVNVVHFNSCVVYYLKILILYTLDGYLCFKIFVIADDSDISILIHVSWRIHISVSQGGAMLGHGIYMSSAFLCNACLLKKLQQFTLLLAVCENFTCSTSVPALLLT